MSKFYTVLVMMVLAIPSLALAGPYFGLGMGIGRTESSLEQLGLVPGLQSDLDAIGSNPSFASSEANYEVAAGWRFGKYFGVELGYTKFGEATDTYQLPGDELVPPNSCNNFGCQSRTWTAQMKMTGVHAFVVGSLPLSSNIDAYAKLGAIRWSASYDGFERSRTFTPDPGVPIPPGNDPVSYDDEGTDLAAGLGLNLKTDSPISLHLDFSYYDVDTTDYVYDVSLMAIYNF